MALLFLFLLLSAFGLIAAIALLNRYAMWLMRRLWDNKNRARRLSFQDEFTLNPNSVIFLGDTHIADFRWEEYFPAVSVRNLGIPDETAAELGQRLAKVLDGKPRQILLHTGGSDVRFGLSIKQTAATVEAILSAIQASTPLTEVVIYGVLPQHPKKAKRIQRLNLELAEHASRFNMVYVDLFGEFADANGGLSEQYSEDGYHLWGPGYETWLALTSGHIQIKGENHEAKK